MIPPIVPPQKLIVHTDRVVRRDTEQFFGIDLNYVRDRDSNRPGAKPLDKTLVEMGVRWLRFPGGEKSDFHLWSVPPYSKPVPQSLGWYADFKGDRMDFDEFMRHARTVHAEPFVVVGYDSKSRTGRTEAQWLETAVAWVRYSKAKGYGVRYWEIGNENWNNQTATPQEMGRIVSEFSRAMKAVDPKIKIGASGDNDTWWKMFLPLAAPSLDFLTVSQYTGWGWRGYNRFLEAPELTDTANGAVAAIDRYAPEADRARLHVIVTETNTKDFAKDGWTDSNDLGHALVTFATLGRLASQPRILSAMVWTTRWMDDAEAPASPFYALGPKNELMPTGQALRMWGAFAKPLMIATEGNDRGTEAFATRTEDGDSMTVWILNRSRSARSVRLKIDGPAFVAAGCNRFSGANDTDRNPLWATLPGVRLANNIYTESALPPLSVTILTLKR